MQYTRARATLRRSLRLLNHFRFEQRDPDRFYSMLATDTYELIEALRADVSPAASCNTVLDVGGGPGYFAAAFEKHGTRYISVEPEGPGTVRGDGMALPFRDDAFDVVFSSNVAEHVPRPWDMGEEMLRVARPGGLVVLSYTIWLGPFGGHETGLLPHYISGAFARDRYARRHGHPPKNSFGTTLFAVSCAEGLRWARRHGTAACFPRYHPRWAWWVTRVPVLREFLVSNLVIVLRKPEQG